MVLLQRRLVLWRLNEEASLMGIEWSCYRIGQFKGGMVMLQRWSV